jgi:hypothetical protein
MLALKRRSHIVHLNAKELSVQCHMPLADVEAGLLVLSSPDRIHIGKPNDGRRIRAVPSGWLIINGEKYQQEMQKISARTRKRRWAEKHRAFILNSQPLANNRTKTVKTSCQSRLGW